MLVSWTRRKFLQKVVLHFCIHATIPTNTSPQCKGWDRPRTPGTEPCSSLGKAVTRAGQVAQPRPGGCGDCATVTDTGHYPPLLHTFRDNSLISTFASSPQELEICPRSGPYLLGTNIFWASLFCVLPALPTVITRGLLHTTEGM